MQDGLNYKWITQYYKKIFGGRVYKLALNIPTTCPNRDGKVGVGGCIFCSGGGSGEYSTVYSQLDNAKARLKDKQCGKYIAYFQSFSNTYLPVEKLDYYVQSVLCDKQICGISIATRPDCIDDDMLEYLSSLNKITHLVVELGLQSACDNTLEHINRGHTFADFEACFARLKGVGIRVCVHIMDGLPGESVADMLKTAQVVADLMPHSVKIHCVYVPKNTKLEQMYNNGEYTPLEMQEYIEILSKQLEILKDIYIERLTGDGERSTLVAPKWTLHKRYFINQLNRYLATNRKLTKNNLQ